MIGDNPELRDLAVLADATPIDWRRVDAILLERAGLTPRECDRLTLSEIEVAMIDLASDRKGESLSDAQIMAYAEWWNKLTPQERLKQGSKDT